LPAGPLIGRADDVRRAVDLLEDTRLLTFVGLGGVGKTALALEVGQALANRGSRLAFLDLQSETSSAALAADVAAAVGAVSPQGDEPEARLRAALPEGTGQVVILDNLEQMAGSSTAIESIVSCAPGLRVIATSRVPLRATSETVMAVKPLEPTAAQELFRVRAAEGGGANRTEVALTGIADLCARLDHLPLAIELAAGRSRLLSPEAILRRLESGGAQQLIARPGDAGRHGSLEAVFELSFRLLSDDQRAALVALSICPARFDLRLAEAICPEIDVLAALEALVDARLVQHEAYDRGEPIMRLLETVRDVCRTLVDADQQASLSQKHLDATLGAVAAERDSILGPERQAAVSRLNSRLADIRTAFAFAMTVDPGKALMLIAPIWRFWPAVGRSQEAREKLGRALAAPSGVRERAWGYAGMAGIVHVMEGYEAAGGPAEEAIRLARRCRDREAELEALPGAALSSIDRGDYQAAITWSNRAVLLAKRTRDVRAQIRAYATLGIAVGLNGDPIRARRHLARSVHLARESVDPLNEGIQLSNLASFELERARPQLALGPAMSAVAVLRRIEGDWYLATAQILAGQALSELGRLDEARPMLIEGAKGIREMGATVETARTLLSSIWYLLRTGQVELALRAFRSAQRELATSHTTTPAALRRAQEEISSTLPRVGVRRFEDTVGLDFPEPAQVLEEVIAVLESRPRRLDRVDHAAFAFTPREAEVARLLGRGWSDRQIADELGISEKTASVHISNIKAKLGVESRLEAALAGRVLDNAAPGAQLYERRTQ
jgi:non-specific serine/threonine protein kinase